MGETSCQAVRPAVCKTNQTSRAVCMNSLAICIHECNLKSAWPCVGRRANSNMRIAGRVTEKGALEPTEQQTKEKKTEIER
jgi:hypothetical protein